MTHWALAPDEDESTMTVAWGQNAANGNRSFQPQTRQTLNDGRDMINR